MGVARLGRRGEAGRPGHGRQGRRGEAEPVFARELHLPELVADHQLLDRGERDRVRDGLHVEAVALVGRDPARGGVRMGQETGGFELGEDAPDGRAGHTEVIALDERQAADAVAQRVVDLDHEGLRAVGQAVDEPHLPHGLGAIEPDAGPLGTELLEGGDVANLSMGFGTANGIDLSGASDEDIRRLATTALVVDIGGGTSDFTVIRLNPERSGHKGGSAQGDRTADILATTGVHIGGTDFDRLLDLAAVMPHLGYKHVGTGGRIVPSSVFFDLSTWHLIHQAYTRKALHFAKELWTDYTDQALHRRLMDALDEQHGHRMLAGVEAAKIACSISGGNAVVNLDFLDRTLTPAIDAQSMELALHSSIAQVVQCAQDCVAAAGLPGVDAVYLTGGSSALRTLIEALRQAMPQATLVEGNRFGGVAAGLAWAGPFLK